MLRSSLSFSTTLLSLISTLCWWWQDLMVFKINDNIIIVPILHSSAGSKRVVVISLAEIPHRVRAQSLNIVPGLQCATSFIQLLKNATLSLSVYALIKIFGKPSSFVNITELQGCIFRLTCSHPELTEDHVLTSSYVKIFRTVTRNAVNKSV